MRKIYSLRHEARAVSRVKRRLSARSVSFSSESSELLSEVFSASAPGKKREKAILHAWGVVTNWWKRRDTSETSDREAGGR